MEYTRAAWFAGDHVEAERFVSMKRICVAVSLVLALARCGGIAKTNGGDLCSPGQRIECDCAGHAKGTRTCSVEGIGYGECVCPGTVGDSGATSDAGGTSPAMCTSKSAWMDGVRGSAEMTPGRACIECHAMTPKSPELTIAGTIYPALHDPDDCNGIEGLGTAVAIMDDRGMEVIPRLQVNRVGNFYSSRVLPAAYRVKVIAQGVESAMQTPVTNGDCNFCHTASGVLGASGRLTKPDR